MTVLVTGADGFVGTWVVRQLLASGRHVVGAVRLGGGPSPLLTEAERVRVQWIGFDLLSADSVDALAGIGAEAVIHLAAVASGADARRDPGHAWTVNAAGTARLAEALARARAEGRADPVLLLASTGEVYGQGEGRPHREDDPTRPCSPYAASKLGAEIAALEAADRTGLRVIVARAFPHTGPGQSDAYLVPALARRLLTAKRIGAPAIKTGNLEPVRDLLDVRDVAGAYLALVDRGRPGAVYNVARGVAYRLRRVVEQLAELIDVRVIVEQDATLLRSNDLRHLVGDPTALRRDTGWQPTIPFEQILRDVIDAQAD